MGRWGDGEMGRWGDGEVGRWGERCVASVIRVFHVTNFWIELSQNVSTLSHVYS